MKASRYNRLFQARDGTWLAFNTWTTALATIEPDELGFFRALLEAPDTTACDTSTKREMREAMVQSHFLIDDGMDEVGTLKADLLRDRFSTEALHLTIAPTLDCNFRCDYCYEDLKRISMSKPVQAAIGRWVRQKTELSRELHVIWYGGEPMLPRSLAAIEAMSSDFLSLATEKNLTYSAQMVTNGYLLDRAKMKRLVELGVEMVQITLDGPQEIHDQRRPLVGGGGTFERIVSNLASIVDLVDIQLRINVDQRNTDSALEVTQYLQDQGLADKMRLYLAMVTVDSAVCGNIQEMCYSSEDFARIELETYAEAARRGLPLSKYPSRVEGAYCSAERLHGYVIAPGGQIFKCWHEVTMNPDGAIGSVLDQEQEPFQKNNEDFWLKWDALEKSACRSCSILPLCHGGCPLEAMEKVDADRGSCDPYLYHLNGIVELKYLTEASVPDQSESRRGKA
ncbi:MAG: SPASM domain-containing protein [Candidatus Krumholzibacteria bacterium]|nr:SPASM domain-containing protein [Candidatus Krumholzibacteria bacterium]